MTIHDVILSVILPLLGVGALLAFIRLLRGPSVPDRVVAVDLLATLMICISSVYAIATDQPAYLDVAVVIALVGFLGTVGFAYYLQRGKR